MKADVSVRNGRYVSGRLVARTRLADVYSGTDRVLDRPVAIIRPHRVTGERTVARGWASLTHPSLTRIWDLDLDDPHPFLITESVETRPLAEVKNLTAGQVARIGMQVAEGLAQVHAHGLAHGKVNARTIGLTKDGTAKLAATTASFNETSEATAAADDIHGLGTALAAVMRELDAGDRAGVWAALLARMTSEDVAVRPPAIDVVAILRGLLPPGEDAVLMYVWSTNGEQAARRRGPSPAIQRSVVLAASIALGLVGLSLYGQGSLPPLNAEEPTLFSVELPLITPDLTDATDLTKDKKSTSASAVTLARTAPASVTTPQESAGSQTTTVRTNGKSAKATNPKANKKKSVGTASTSSTGSAKGSAKR